MLLLFSNDAYTNIAGAISNVATTVNLEAGAGALFPSPTPGVSYFIATFEDSATGLVKEIVHVTGVTGDTMTIVRAQEGTAAQSWQSGDIFGALITAGCLQAMSQSGSLTNTSIEYFGIDTSVIANQVVVSSLVPALIGPLVEGIVCNIRINHTNTGATTAAINGGSPITVKHGDNGSLIAGDIVSGMEARLIYTNTSTWQLTAPATPGGNAPVTQFFTGSDSSSTVNVMTVTTVPSFTSMGSVNNASLFSITVNAPNNTGAVTLSLNGLTTHPILRSDGSTLLAGDILFGTKALVVWAAGGSNFKLMNPDNIQGATGATGPPGATGATGPAGARGPAGPAWNFVAYGVGAVVLMAYYAFSGPARGTPPAFPGTWQEQGEFQVGEGIGGGGGFYNYCAVWQRIA